MNLKSNEKKKAFLPSVHTYKMSRYHAVVRMDDVVA